MIGRMLMVPLALMALAARADAAFYGVSNTSTFSFPTANADRAVDTLTFTGSAQTFTGANFNQWNDGVFRRNNASGTADTFLWNADIPRDMNSSAGVYSGNPDRADASTPYPGEAFSVATLREVFGANSIAGSDPFQNLSYIIDGEAVGTPFGPDQVYYQVDLLYGPGKFIVADADPNTIELTVLERGLNSQIRVFGLLEGGATTGSSLLLNFNTATALYQLNTIEIGGNQPVGGLGVSLETWAGQKLVGFRLQYDANGVNMGGPDLVAVGSVVAVPEPATWIQAGIGGSALLLGGLAGRRRRRLAA